MLGERLCRKEQEVQPSELVLHAMSVCLFVQRSLAHLNILIARSRCRRGSRRWCRRGLASVLRDHAPEVALDGLTLEDAEVALGRDVRLFRTGRADDANGGVVDGELLVLLQGLTQCVQTMADQLLQCAYAIGG